jgi:pantetheine-phosphate adenylyltransferase
LIARKRRFREVAVGGTFDSLHRGHKILIRTAFRAGDRVIIGLSRNGFVRQLVKNHRVDSYRKRKHELLSFLKKERLAGRARIVPLDDPCGPAIKDSAIEALVVSRLTKKMADKINAIRRHRGLKSLPVLSIGMVVAEDFDPISSTRIRAGEIDREGYLAPGHVTKRSSTRAHS